MCKKLHFLCPLCTLMTCGKLHSSCFPSSRRPLRLHPSHTHTLTVVTLRHVASPHTVFLAGPSSRWDMVTGVSLFHVLMLLVRPTLWTNEKVTYVQCSVFNPSSALLYNGFIYCSNSLHNFCSSKYSGEKVTQEKSIKLYCKARSLFPLCNHTHKYCQLIMI